MYYFKETEDYIEKYNITFDLEKLNELKKEIIDNCSEVEHKEINTPIEPENNPLKIRNLKKGKQVGTRTFANGQSIPLYTYNYDEYTYPYLVNLIDNLINGETNSLEEIFIPNKQKEKHYDLRLKNYKKRNINKKFNEYEKINYFDIQKKREKLNELDKLILDYEKMATIKPVGPYYEKVKALITLELVAKLPIEYLNKIIYFYEDETIINKTKKKHK